MIIPEGFELNSYGRFPINKNGRRLKTNNTGQVVYKNGKPVLNNDNNIQLPKRIIIYKDPLSKFLYILEKNGEVEKKIKLNSSKKSEKYSNGRPVILGEHGYPINNKGQILKFDQKTGDLSKNSNGNPYVYNPYPGGFKIPEKDIVYRYPQFVSAQTQHRNNKQMSFLSSQGPGQTQVPTVFGRQHEYIPPGRLKVNTPPKSVLIYNNRIPGNKENNNSPLLQHIGQLQKNKKKGLLSKLSIFGKK
jgi:hypothetical protein